MFKGRKLVIVLVGVGVALYVIGLISGGSADGKLAFVMRETGATVGELRFSAWSQLPQGGRSEGELTGIVRAVMEALGKSAGNCRFYSLAAGGQRAVLAEANDNDEQVCVAARVFGPAGSADSRAYLTVSVRLTGGEVWAGKVWRSRIAGLFPAMGIEPQITTCLVGWLDGKLDKKQWLNKFAVAGQAVYALPVDTFVEPGLANVAYFSPVLPECIRVGYKPINLNMAMRYSPDENRTYIIVGSPVIIGEY